MRPQPCCQTVGSVCATGASMAEGEPWYIDWRQWRLRRSGLEGSKLIFFPSMLECGGSVVCWELRPFAHALGFVGKGWRLCTWWRRYEEAVVRDLFSQVGLQPADIKLSKKSLALRTSRALSRR